jgi:hypothetical protein
VGGAIFFSPGLGGRQFFFAPGRKMSKCGTDVTIQTFQVPYHVLWVMHATQTFQRVINDVSRGLNFVFTSIDGVLIASRNEDKHERHVGTVLEHYQTRYRD